MGILGSILGVAGSILGKPKTTTSGQNLLSTLQAAQRAEKYGFNPLEALRSGAAGIGPSVSGGIPGLASSLASVGDAVDPATRAAEKQESERRKLDLDLARIKLDQARSGFALPQGDYVNGGARLGNRAEAWAAPGSADTVTRYNPERTAVQVGGKMVKPASGWSDAEEIERRYGDAASWAYGFGTIAADVAETVGPSDLKDGAGLDNISDLPLKERPPRWQAREWGRLPDGWDPADEGGRPYWFKGGDRNHVTYVPPKQWKGK